MLFNCIANTNEISTIKMPTAPLIFNFVTLNILRNQIRLGDDKTNVINLDNRMAWPDMIYVPALMQKYL